MRLIVICTLTAVLVGCGSLEPASEKLPADNDVLVDRTGGQLIVPAVVVHPKDKPCIDDWGQRVQAFAGCRRAAGGPAKFADYFVFLADLSTEDVYQGLLDLGAKPRVHYSTPEAKKRTGLKKTTTAADYLQGDPIQLSIFWDQEGRRYERPYQDFAQEKVIVEGGEVVKPWSPHYVFHGSGAIHASGTGCIACPCDCAGGIIADNRYPVFNPKPIVRFDWSKAPPVGTRVYIRIRPSLTRE
jgi:hypothetical protein